jgi:hypothetical protein
MKIPSLRSTVARSPLLAVVESVPAAGTSIVTVPVVGRVVPDGHENKNTGGVVLAPVLAPLITSSMIIFEETVPVRHCGEVGNVAALALHW